MKLYNKCLFTLIYFISSLNFILAGNENNNKKVVKAPLPQWVELVKARITTNIKGEEISDGYNYLLIDNQAEVSLKSNYYHYCRKIHSDLGAQNGSEIKVEFDPSYQKLNFHKLIIWRGQKAIDKLAISKFEVIQKEKNQESFMYDGHFSAFTILEDIRAGDVIEYAFSIEGFNPILNDHYTDIFDLEFTDPVDEVSVKVFSPINKKLNYKVFNADYKPEINEKNGKIIYNITRKDIKGLKMEDLTPSWYYPYDYIAFSDYPSWEVLKGELESVFFVQPANTGELASKINEIKAASKTKEEQLVKTLFFVQNEIRYTGFEHGINSFIPHAPDKVLKRRFGDCKDKSLLLCNLLNQQGIEAFPVLVNTISKHTIQDWLPSPFTFNHCIVKVILGNEAFFYDPTNNFQEGSYNKIHQPNYGKCLVLNKKKEGLTDHKAYTFNKVEIEENFDIPDFDSSVVFTITTSYYGGEADFQRYYFANNNFESIKENYINFYAKVFPNIQIGDSLSFIDNKSENIFTTIEKYRIFDFWVPADSSVNNGKYYASIYPLNFSERINNPTTKIRKMPIALYFPYEYKHKTIVNLPIEWEVKNHTDKVKNDFFEYIRSTFYKNKVLTIDYEYINYRSFVPENKTSKYISDLKQVNNLLDYELSVDRNINTATVGEITEFNWMMAFVALFTIFGGAILVYLLYKYDPENNAPFPDQKFNGWLILFAIALIISPFRIAWETFFAMDFFDKNVTDALFKKEYSTYNPILGAVVIFELIFNILQILIYSLFIVLYFTRRTSFPKLFYLNAMFAVSFYTLDTFLAASYTTVDTVEQNKEYVDLVKTLIPLIGWSLYFKISQKVKITFVNRLNRDDNYENDGIEIFEGKYNY